MADFHFRLHFFLPSLHINLLSVSSHISSSISVSHVRSLTCGEISLKKICSFHLLFLYENRKRKDRKSQRSWIVAEFFKNIFFNFYSHIFACGSLILFVLHWFDWRYTYPFLLSVNQLVIRRWQYFKQLLLDMLPILKLKNCMRKRREKNVVKSQVKKKCDSARAGRNKMAPKQGYYSKNDHARKKWNHPDDSFINISTNTEKLTWI